MQAVSRMPLLCPRCAPAVPPQCLVGPCLFFKRMYPSILSFKTINKLKLSFECGIPRPQDVGHVRSVPLAVIRVSNEFEDFRCHRGVTVIQCNKIWDFLTFCFLIFPKSCKKVVKKTCQKTVKKLSKNF
jgi:hypothetical protein